MISTCDKSMWVQNPSVVSVSLGEHWQLLPNEWAPDIFNVCCAHRVIGATCACMVVMGNIMKMKCTHQARSQDFQKGGDKIG